MTTLPGRLLSVIAPSFCWGCGGDARAGSPLCRGCLGALRWLPAEPVALAGVATWAPLAYEGPAAALARALKYRGAVALAEPMAARMAANAPDGVLGGDAALVPVPLHPARRRRRGYNQAQLLAAALARRAGLRCEDCLRRTGSRSRQVGRGRAERIAGIAGRVELAPGATVPARAALVDDVATTGATLAACAEALRDAGCAVLGAVTFARTPGR